MKYIVYFSEDERKRQFINLQTAAMMTGSLPSCSQSSSSSSSSSSTSSTGSQGTGGGNGFHNGHVRNDDQFVDDLVSRLLLEDSGDDLVNGLNSLLKQ